MVDQGDDIPLPAHVYVPGRSPRHPDNWFDALKASVTPDIAPEDLKSTKAFRAGLKYLENGYYWECHEVLEAVWMQTKDPSPQRDMVLAIIQLANARLKILMGRPNAAMRLCDMVETHLSRCPKTKLSLGLHVSDLQEQVNTTRSIARDAF